MISPKFKRIFLVSIIVFFIHAFEEYVTGYYNEAPFHFLMQPLLTMSFPAALFLCTLITLFSILLVLYGVTVSKKVHLWLLSFPAILYISELHHIWDSFSVWKYTPGLITSFLFVPVSFLYIRELRGLSLRG